ncbi:MAG: nucleotidyltransferase [Chloroflexi bacterium]|nr:nucleotidyltransferase [Chloroflexota bacterium]
MPLIDVFRALNKLKQRRVVRDWALIGSVAATTYLGPINTLDVDVVVLVESDEEWYRALQGVQDLTGAHWDGLYQVVAGVPVQVLPSNMNLLYEDAVRGAHLRRAGNVRIRVASPEHLIVLALVAFRPEKDWGRILALRAHADEKKLKGLLERFDDEKGTLAARLARLSGEGYPREGED